MLHCRYISVTAQCCPTGCYITVALPLHYRYSAMLPHWLLHWLLHYRFSAMLPYWLLYDVLLRRLVLRITTTRAAACSNRSPFCPFCPRSAPRPPLPPQGCMAVTWPSHGRHIAVTLPLHLPPQGRNTTVTLPLHYRYTTVALPLRYRCATVALGATGGSRRCRHYQEEPTPCNGNVTVM